MIKKAVLLMLAAALVLSLAGCASKLPEGFDEKLVTSQAQIAVDLLNLRDYDKVVAAFRADLQAQVTADTLKSALDQTLNDSGTFVEFKKIAMGSTADKATGEQYAVAVVVCKYENATRTFTISLDKNYDLVGLYMK